MAKFRIVITHLDEEGEEHWGDTTYTHLEATSSGEALFRAALDCSIWDILCIVSGYEDASEHMDIIRKKLFNYLEGQVIGSGYKKGS